MGKRILFLATLLYWAMGTTSAQSIQVDPGEMNGSIHHQEDAKLIAMPLLGDAEQQQFAQTVKDIHFDFDKSDLRAEDRETLAHNADWLKAHPEVTITLEGDADERGSIVYNLVLSGERAMTVKDALVEMGVPADRIVFATGWGKLYPVCTQSDESCWSQNRCTHFETWPRVEEQTRVASR